MQQLAETVNFIRNIYPHTPSTGIILGSGLGNLVNEIEVEAAIEYSQLPHFPVSTVKGHGGKLLLGKLSGKTIALKDNICLAGVPMMNGASTLEGYIPDMDATIVTRILDAGGTIVGKTHCEYFCFSGGSHTGAKGPVHNPYKMGYSAGGSSSGSGVVVATGEVDMAIGGDQGGSIRMPSSFCGL